MPGHARKLRAKARESGGFTLPELSVAATVFLVVVAIIGPFFLASQRQVVNQSDRTERMDRTRDGISKMMREIRGGASFANTGAQTLDVLVPVGNGTAGLSATDMHWIRYSCSSAGSISGTRKCTRRDVTAAGSTATVADLVVNTTNFAFAASGRTVTIQLALDLDEADNPVVLTDAATLRNCVNGSGVPTVCT